MILWTIMPDEVVWSLEREMNPLDQKQEMIPLKNGFLQVREVSNQIWQIEQLVSTDPEDYLKDQYQPGRILKHSHC